MGSLLGSFSFVFVLLKFFEPGRYIIGRANFHLSGLAEFLSLSHSGGTKDVSDFINGSVKLRGSGGSSTQLNENVLNVLNAFSLDQESLNILFGFLQLSLEFSVLLFDVFIVLIEFFIFVSEQKNLLLLFFNVTDQVRVRLVGLVQ